LLRDHWRSHRNPRWIFPAATRRPKRPICDPQVNPIGPTRPAEGIWPCPKADRDTKAGSRPHPPTQLRHPSSRSGCPYPAHPGVPRAQRFDHHRDLHTRYSRAPRSSPRSCQ
jgi:hypothetical protein